MPQHFRTPSETLSIAHDALIALVKLLAQQAARDFAAPLASQPSATRPAIGEQLK
jgi:hypothetical protein